MISKWVRKNPLLAHLVQFTITVLLLSIVLLYIVYRYGNKIDEVDTNTNCMKEIITNIIKTEK